MFDLKPPSAKLEIYFSLSISLKKKHVFHFCYAIWDILKFIYIKDKFDWA